MKPRAVLIDNGGPWVELISPYVGALVSDIKAHIPAGARKYQPEAKSWLVLSGYKKYLLNLAQRHCDVLDTARLSPAAQALPAPESPLRAAYAVLDLLPSASDELVKAAYRIKAKAAHPDAGGTHEAMVRVNKALEALTK